MCDFETRIVPERDVFNFDLLNVRVFAALYDYRIIQKINRSGLLINRTNLFEHDEIATGTRTAFPLVPSPRVLRDYYRSDYVNADCLSLVRRFPLYSADERALPWPSLSSKLARRPRLRLTMWRGTRVSLSYVEAEFH